MTEAPPMARGDAENQLMELRDYLTRLTEELEYLLTHLEADNIDDTTFARIQQMIPDAYTGLPPMDGEASGGSANAWARGDHRHPTDTSRAAATDLSAHVGDTANPHSVTKAQVGLGNVDNVQQYSVSNPPPTPSASDVGAIPATEKGNAGGVAELDANGMVPSAQLPSYVDDVLEYASLSAFPATGEAGKIYVALDTNLTYRWSGSAYVEISESLALGETSSTAYRGDRGKTAYDHSQVVSGNPHQVTAAEVGARPDTWTPSASDVGAQPEITASGILKGDGLGGVSAATAGTDYQTPLAAGTDYQTPLVADVDYQTPLVAGTDYQTPLAAGTDYQTPLVAGTDYQTPLVAGTDYATPAMIPTVPDPSDATPQDLGTAAAGSSGDYSRADHVHNMPDADDIGYDNTVSGLSASDVQAALDELAAGGGGGGGGPSPATATPVMDGSGAVGTSLLYAREDHEHPSDTAKQDAITASGILKGDGAGNVSAAVAGTDYQTPMVAGTDYQTPLVAGTDYQTPLAAGTDYQTPLVAGTDYATPAMIPSVPSPSDSTPQDLGTAAAGTSSNYSRADHVHKKPSAADIGAYVKPSSGIPASDLASGVIPSVPAAYTSNPAMDGTASPGSSGSWAKGDHVHPSDTSRVPVYGMGENLLRNWYFLNSVNQRNISTVNATSNNVYTVDRWNAYRVIVAWGAGDPLVFYASNSGTPTGYIHQWIDKDITGKSVTVSVLLQNNILLTVSGVLSEGTTLTTNNVGNVEAWVRKLAGDKPEFFIWSRALNVQAKVIAAKLELGTQQTLCHNEGTDANPVWVLNEVPDYEAELIKCQTSTADSSDTYANKSLATEQELAPTENGLTASQAYAVGQYFCRNGKTCRAKTAIASGATLTLNTNYVEVSGGALNDFNPIFNQIFSTATSVASDTTVTATEALNAYADVIIIFNTASTDPAASRGLITVPVNTLNANGNYPVTMGSGVGSVRLVWSSSQPTKLRVISTSFATIYITAIYGRK